MVFECGCGAMKFCPRCGTRLVATKIEHNNNRVPVLKCPKCGYVEETQAHRTPLKKISHSPQELIAVIGKEEQKLRTLPTAKVECPKCGNTLAYVWQVQTRSSDESSTLFFRCTKCGYTFREYG